MSDNENEEFEDRGRKRSRVLSEAHIASSAAQHHYDSSFVRTDEHRNRLFRIEAEALVGARAAQAGGARYAAVDDANAADLADEDRDDGDGDGDGDSVASEDRKQAGGPRVGLPAYLRQRVNAVQDAAAQPRRKRVRFEENGERLHEEFRRDIMQVQAGQEDQMDDVKEEIELPVQYVPLHNNAWYNDDEDAYSSDCFLCKYPALVKHGGSRMDRLIAMMNDNYGRISNQELANAVQLYYNKNIRFYERDAHDAFPAWSKKTIIEHVEKHSPTAVGMNLRTIRDLNSMIDVIQQESLCVLDADQNRSLDPKNTKLYLQLVKARRECMRDNERYTSSRH